jgi:hypothetical protein
MPVKRKALRDPGQRRFRSTELALSGHERPSAQPISKEDMMRGVLTLLLLMGIAGAAHAAEATPATRADAEPPAATAQERSAPVVTPILDVREVVREPAGNEAVAAQPPRNWLWTVAAIVVAGVILAVIL